MPRAHVSRVMMDVTAPSRYALMTATATASALMALASAIWVMVVLHASNCAHPLVLETVSALMAHASASLATTVLDARS